MHFVFLIIKLTNMFIFRSGIVQTLFNVKNLWIRVQTPLLQFNIHHVQKNDIN